MITSPESQSLLLSIVIPLKGRYDYFFTLGHSLRENVSPGVELIVVIDSEDCQGIAERVSLQESFPEIDFILAPRPGAGPARNHGLEASQGDFVWFVDADDLVPKGAFNIVLDTIAHNRADIYLFSALEIGEPLEARRILPEPGHPLVRGGEKFLQVDRKSSDHLFQLTNPAPWNKIFRREFLLDLHLRFSDLPSSNDVALTYSALALAQNVFISPKSIYLYRRGARGSLQGRPDTNSLVLALEELTGRLKRHEVYSRYEVSLKKLSKSMVAASFARSPSLLGLFEALKRHPTLAGRLGFVSWLAILRVVILRKFSFRLLSRLLTVGAFSPKR